MQDCNLMVERASELTPRRYYEEYVRGETPVVITGLLEQWPALKKWGPGYFRERHGTHPVTVEVQGRKDPRQFFPERKEIPLTLAEFIDRLPVEQPKHYLQKSNLLLELPELRQDARLEDIQAYQVTAPPYPAWLAKSFRLVPLFWFGTQGTFSTLHYDPSNNLFAQVMGRKQFYLYAPGDGPRLYARDHELCTSGLCLGTFSPVEVEHPDLERHPDFTRAKRYQVTLEPGDVLYIPAGWWHYVKGMEVGISISNWWYDHPMRLQSVADTLRGAACLARRTLGLRRPRSRA
jgi:lysine-specific demethylase 8